MNPIFRTIFVLSLVTVVGSGCSAHRSSRNMMSEQSADLSISQAPVASETLLAEFKWKGRPSGEIAPGYEVELSSTEDERLNGRFRVAFDGNLELPYNITVAAAGVSEKGLNDKIVSAYRAFFQTPPAMAVKVVDKKFAVDVRGLVKKPGQFLMKSTASLDEIIAEAGGLQEASPQNPMARYARIKQGDGSTLVNISDYYAGGEVVNPKWQGGEIVFFQTEAGVSVNAAGNENYLQMLGEVKVAGQYQYRENADLLDYIVRAGGPNDRADLDNIQIIREEAGQKISMVAEIESVEDRNQIPHLKGGDIVIVHAQNPTSFDKKTRRVSEVAQVFTAIATVILLFVTL